MLSGAATGLMGSLLGLGHGVLLATPVLITVVLAAGLLMGARLVLPVGCLWVLLVLLPSLMVELRS